MLHFPGDRRSGTVLSLMRRLMSLATSSRAQSSPPPLSPASPALRSSSFELGLLDAPGRKVVIHLLFDCKKKIREPLGLTDHHGFFNACVEFGRVGACRRKSSGIFQSNITGRRRSIRDLLDKGTLSCLSALHRAEKQRAYPTRSPGIRTDPQPLGHFPKRFFVPLRLFSNLWLVRGEHLTKGSPAGANRTYAFSDTNSDTHSKVITESVSVLNSPRSNSGLCTIAEPRGIVVWTPSMEN